MTQRKIEVGWGRFDDLDRAHDGEDETMGWPTRRAAPALDSGSSLLNAHHLHNELGIPPTAPSARGARHDLCCCAVLEIGATH